MFSSPIADHISAANRRRSRALGLFAIMLALSVILVLASAATRASAAEPGVVLNEGFSQQGEQGVSALGVGWVRAVVTWSQFEQQPGQLNGPALASLEAGIAALPHGTKVLLDVVDSPAWETGSSDQNTPPANPADYAAFAGKLAARFSTRVAAYEIWNEEDTPLWWVGAPDPGAYTALLRAAYPAIKAGDKSATVVLGGLTGNDYEYLEELYKDGAKGYFDAVGVHTDTACNTLSPYDFIRNGREDPRINRWAFLGYQEVHRVMLANGDAKPIWMTELGWNTSTQLCDQGVSEGVAPGGVSEQTQATYLTQAYHCLALAPYVQVGIWFGLQESEPFGTPIDSYGLLNDSLLRKPAFTALAEYAHHGDRLTEPCGDFSGPHIKVARPLLKRGHAAVHYSGPLPIAVSATDPLGVGRITLAYDGHKLASFTRKPGLASLSGYLDWQGAKHITLGRHVLSVLAVDMKGNVTTSYLVIIHGAEPKKKHHK